MRRNRTFIIFSIEVVFSRIYPSPNQFLNHHLLHHQNLIRKKIVKIKNQMKIEMKVKMEESRVVNLRKRKSG